jgi:hypothetical protein
MMTKKQIKAERAAKWAAAVSDGRVVRYSDGMEFRSFETRDAAAAFAAARNADGDASAAVVKP